MVIEIEDFLTVDQCNTFIEMIDKNNYPSGVTTQDENRVTRSDYRTSNTCNLKEDDELVSTIKQKISEIVDLPIKNGEPLQGQVYREEQYFKKHTDFFEAGSYYNHCLHSGQRVKTFMIYLNEDMEGGTTYFPKLDKHFKPKVGKALLWDNMVDGKLNYDALHEGTSIDSGSKYIITSWWRENDWDGTKDALLAAEYHKNKEKEKQMSKTYSSKEDFPKITAEGFKVIPVPEKAWKFIKEGYELLKSKEKVENFPNIEGVISGSEKPTSLMSFDNFSSLRDLILEELKPIHEEWSKEKLKPSALYGIRSYNKGATLISHTDRLTTHHVSSIIIVDKELNCGCGKTKGVAKDWPLDFVDHDGKEHKVFAEIGEMILYESATCAHGRLEPLKGEWFRNLFAHYALEDYTYEPK